MPSFFAYIGPEVPLAFGSILAAIGGVFIFFWRWTGGWLVNRFRKQKHD
ncbi:MAG: hypothetical protein H6807_04530 [Planctomycetes bacterium]|nr:hypothetical protein [Planctomycetota bacterium]